MNADTALDWFRAVLAVFLLYVGLRRTSSAGLVRSALLLVGALYLLIAVLGLISPTVGGLLPNGLTGFDIVFHALTGIVALAFGIERSAYRDRPALQQ